MLKERAKCTVSLFLAGMAATNQKSTIGFNAAPTSALENKFYWPPDYSVAL
jgi:hypothetical protein